MRNEISREEHELLLNLFILKMRYEFYFEFIDWENSEYEELMNSADIIVLKDCFPMDEYHLPLMFSLLLGGNVNGNVVVNLNEV